MPVYLAPTFGAGYQAFDTNGLPLNGGFISTFAAGTATPLSTWTTSTGLIANPTSITLGTDGRPPNEIWMTGSTTYLFQLFTSSGVSIKSYDNLYGINDPAVVGNTGVQWAVAAGTVNVITATYTPANTSLTDGLLCAIRTSGANTSTTPSFSPDGLVAHTITKLGGAAVVANEWGTNYEILLRYNLAATRWELISAAKSTQPTRTVITSSSTSVYTTPVGATRIYVRIAGAGGGGGAATVNNGTVGVSTTIFGTMSASTGGGGAAAGGSGGNGGAAAGGDINITGGAGQGGSNMTGTGASAAGGNGGTHPLGGAGAGGAATTDGVPATGFGAGGGGAGCNAGGASAGGGGAGGYSEKLILAPASSFAYVVGTAGTGGAAGTHAGGGGVAGVIIVDEFYN